MHWKDVYQMKEILLFTLIQCEIEHVKQKPLELRAHALLATSYRTLAQIYEDPRKSDPEEEHLFISLEYSTPPMLHKFKRASLHALEELKILDAYAPETPWVQLQLAQLYRALEEPQKEIEAYETLLKTSPHDPELLHHLGTLYFCQGRNAEGLRLYATLQESDAAKAEELIAYYDAIFSDDF